MKTGSINQIIRFEATAQEVYDVLMTAEILSIITGAEAKMSVDIGGTFNLFDGYCTGYNMELIAHQKIVQAWNFEEEGWPAEHYSICTFLLIEEEDATLLHFNQENIPAHQVAALEEGWDNYFWTPMHDYFSMQ